MLKFLIPFLIVSGIGAEESKLPPLLNKHCYECHVKKSKGKFNLKDLGSSVSKDNVKQWYEMLDQVTSKEMPPEEDSEMTDGKREIHELLERDNQLQRAMDVLKGVLVFERKLV